MFKKETPMGSEGVDPKLVPEIAGLTFSSSIPQRQFAEDGAKETTDSKVDGDQPTFEMPPFANGEDVRKNYVSPGRM